MTRLPALTQAQLGTSASELVLIAKSGFSKGLRKLADATPRVVLKEAAEILDELKGTGR